jgi:hypothetical protein
MNITPLATFGYVAFLVDAEANETRDVTLTDRGFSSSGYYFYVKGRSAVNVVETGQVLEDRTAGWLNLERVDGRADSTGTAHVVFLEDTQWLCIPHVRNPGGLPDLSSLVLDDGATHILTQGTDLYLVRGTLVIGDNTFVGPRQIRVRSGDVAATSQGTSYSLRFL